MYLNWLILLASILKPKKVLAERSEFLQNHHREKDQQQDAYFPNIYP